MGISRSRGYSWENELVKRLTLCGWKTRRFAAANNFPDVIGTNSNYSTLIVTEAKAYSSDNIYIPVEEYHRCFDICDMFNLYKKRMSMFAFKFNRIIGKRGIRYYFGVIDHQDYIDDGKKDLIISCNYNNGIKQKFVNQVSFDSFNLMATSKPECNTAYIPNAYNSIKEITTIYKI